MKEYFNISTGNWYFHLIIGILLFLLIQWLVGKFTKKRIVNIVVSFVSSIFLTPIVFYFLFNIVLTVLFYEYHPELKFDSTKWTENTNERHHMRKDLIESNILLGKTKNEVIEFLGIPENNINVAIDTVKNWTYYLGSEGHGMGWKFHYMSLNFINGKVEKAENNEFID